MLSKLDTLVIINTQFNMLKYEFTINICMFLSL
jgi:hypothetical protein